MSSLMIKHLRLKNRHLKISSIKCRKYAIDSQRPTIESLMFKISPAFLAVSEA